MRVILMSIMLAATWFATPGLVHAQQRTGQTELGHPLDRKELLRLPRRDAAPRLTLKRALQLAEGFIRRQRIDISSCYLFEARLIETESDKESSWHFWWVGFRRNDAPAEDVRITVQMNGRVDREQVTPPSSP